MVPSYSKVKTLHWGVTYTTFCSSKWDIFHYRLKKKGMLVAPYNPLTSMPPLRKQEHDVFWATKCKVEVRHLLAQRCSRAAFIWLSLG